MADKLTKIFVDAHCFDNEYQGSRTFVKEIYSVLSKKKDVHLYLAAYNTEYLKTIFPSAENITLLKYKFRSSFIRLAYDIPRMIKKHRVDFAHFQYITPLIKNCKQIVTIHDVIFNDYPEEFSKTYRVVKKFLYKRSTKKADVLTTVSAFSKSSIQKNLKTSGSIHIIPNGVNENYFDAYNKANAKAYIKKRYGIDKFILYVSRIEPRKNHLSALKAFVELELWRKGYRLVFIGHTSMPVPELYNLIVGSDEIQDSIFFVNNIKEDELLQFYRSAEIFIYPSKAEGFGIPPLEAAAAKVPVICSNSSAMKEFSFFGNYHVDPFDYNDIKAKLDQMLTKGNCPETLNRISEKVKSDYTWKDSAEKLYQLIKAH